MFEKHVNIIMMFTIACIAILVIIYTRERVPTSEKGRMYFWQLSFIQKVSGLNPYRAFDIYCNAI